MTMNQPVHAQPARNIKIKLLAPKPPSKARQPATATKPSHGEASVGELPVLTGVTVPVKRKKPVDSEADTDHSDTQQPDQDGKAIKKKKLSKKISDSKKKSRTDDHDTEDTQDVQPLVQKKRGRTQKPIKEKLKAGLQPFNASVFVSVKNPPQLIRGKTHRTDKLAAQEPCIKGPFTLIRSMKWAEFLYEIAHGLVLTKKTYVSTAFLGESRSRRPICHSQMRKCSRQCGSKSNQRIVLPLLSLFTTPSASSRKVKGNMLLET